MGSLKHKISALMCRISSPSGGGGRGEEREGQQKKQLVLFSFPSAEFQKKKKSRRPKFLLQGSSCALLCVRACVFV